MHQPLTDEELLEAHRDGDPRALEQLMRRYEQDLLAFLTRYLGKRAAAEDVFQETFLQVHLSADTFDASRRFKPWLFTIAVNKARDHHRKHGKRTTLSLSGEVHEEGRTRFVDLLATDEPEPPEPVADLDHRAAVRAVLDALPEHFREILLLGYFQRMAYGQIAECLDIPLGTVKSRLHAAVAAFARAWKSRSLSAADETGEDAP